jgi:peptidoglycan/xylan/chitin deacetylase (PgdA/CDA1 family)
LKDNYPVMPSSAILTYHSQNISGNSTADNDHAALREDLEALHSAGYRFITLGKLIDHLEGKSAQEDFSSSVCLTFDDGCDFDVRDLEYPGIGPQRSFLAILEDFVKKHGPQAQPDLHATSFVIASSEAREIIDARSLFAQGWMSDDWWRDAADSDLMAIGNHGWDHNHPDLASDGSNRGDFISIDTAMECEKQVIRAARFIAGKCGHWPEFFCYPFGESSTYIREEFFPGQLSRHRCRAALGTDAGLVTRKSDRWNLPRLVCGRDWKTPARLLEILA